MAFDLQEELLGLCQAFASEGIEYAVCGGMAVAVHGYPRATQDIDMLVREEDLESEHRQEQTEAAVAPH